MDPQDPGTAEGTEGVVDVLACTGEQKGFGCPCGKNDDCESGFCTDVEGGKICTQTCVESCPEGFACTGVQGSRDQLYICLPKFAKLCQPCKEHLDCQAKGGTGLASCLEYGTEGKFCGGYCGDAPCPSGYDCASVLLGDGTTTKQCKLAQGSCQCNSLGKALGMKTDCGLTNEFGTCPGERTCMPSGLSACDAPAPSAEACDQLDNDCNGVTDDIKKDQVCYKTSEFGKCAGKPACVGGVEVCVADTAAPEICDGKDNDCNGYTDEGFKDTDKDNQADCVDSDDDNDGIPDETDNCPLDANPNQADLDKDGKGDACDPDMDGDSFLNAVDCAPADATVFPGAKEICDGKDNDCNGKIDDGLCDDGVACTFDYCDAATGACGHASNDGLCDDGNACTQDRCDAVKGCLADKLSGTACDDGDKCTLADECEEGICKGQSVAGCCTDAADCNDKNPCTFDKCDVTTGSCSHETAGFEGKPCVADNDGCTKADACELGVCRKGPTVDCGPSPIECQASKCKSTGPDTYTCEMGFADPGSTCSDKDPCTLLDQCDGKGSCVPGPVSPDCCKAAADCDDGNACTLDVCDFATGKCKNINVADGTACNADGSGCTQNDSCQAGTCAPGSPVKCQASFDPCFTSTCVSTGPKSYTCDLVPASAGTVCDDDDVCTLNDKCDGSGKCLPGTALPKCCKLPKDCDDKNPCTQDTCNVLTGECGHVTVANGTLCDADANGCTTGDKCAQGVCMPGSPAVCPVSTNPCVENACKSLDAQNYTCQATPVQAGLPCDDGNSCSYNDKCDGNGACAGTALPSCCVTANDCDDHNSCTTDLCNAGTGKCSHTPLADNTPCNADDSGCTQNDTCLSGSCVAGTPALCQAGTDPCVKKTCKSTGANSFTCTEAFADTTVPCDDGKFCTVNDHCDGAGKCTGGAPMDCGATVGSCQQATCSEVKKRCDVVNKGDGAECSDGDGCTVGDVCMAGDCKPGAAADCSKYTDTCNVGSCKSLGDVFYQCQKVVKPQGVACEDGQFCTSGETCDGNGACVGGAPRDCSAEVGDACNTAYCDDLSKTCVKTKKADGTLCDDGKVCTLVDSCVNGICTGQQDACVEERLSVSGPGLHRPALGSLGYGRYASQWTGDAAQNYLRLSDGYGSRENEEVQVATGDVQPFTPMAVRSTGEFVVLGYNGPASISQHCGYGGCAEISYTGYFTARKYAYDGALLAEKNVRSFKGYGGCGSYSTCGYSMTGISAVPLSFPDGTYGILESWTTSGNANPAAKDVRFTPMASDMTPGAPVVVVPAAKILGPGRFDARMEAGDSDRYVVAWVDAGGTKIYANRFLKTGQPENPTEWLVSDEGTGNEVFAVKVLTMPDGKFAVAWDVNNKDGNGRGVYVKRFYPNGDPLPGSQLKVNGNIQGDQRLGGADVFDDGGFVVVYDDSKGDVNGYAVKAQRFKGSDGKADGVELTVNVTAPGDQYQPNVAVLTSGEWVVAYVDSGKVAWTRRYYRDGTPSMGRVELRANATTKGAQVNPKAAVASTGNVLIVFESPVFGKEVSEILGRVFDATGKEVKSEFQVNTYDKDAQTAPSVAGGPDRFVVAWDSMNQDADVDGIYAQLYDGSGKTLGKEFQAAKTTTGAQRFPSVGMLSGGTFLVAYNGQVAQAASQSDVFGRIFDKDGNLVKDEFMVNVYTTKAQDRPLVVQVPGKSEFLVFWESKDQDSVGGLGVYARKFNTSGVALSDEIAVNTTTGNDQKAVAASVSAAGKVTACWDTYSQDSTNTWGVACQILNYNDLTVAGGEFYPYAVKTGAQQGASVVYLPSGDFLVAWGTEQVDSGGFAVQYQRFSPAGQTIGPRVVANRYWTGDQYRPFLAPLSSGSFFVGWQSEGQDGDSSGDYFRVMPPQ